MTNKQFSEGPLNVLGDVLQPCCFEPITGYYRDGFCKTCDEDKGRHVICAQVTEAFLAFTATRGNDLTRPLANFPGLKPGDRWCLCALRWKEAYIAGFAPPVLLASCHERVLDTIPLDVLKEYAISPNH